MWLIKSWTLTRSLLWKPRSGLRRCNPARAEAGKWAKSRMLNPSNKMAIPTAKHLFIWDFPYARLINIATSPYRHKLANYSQSRKYSLLFRAVPVNFNDLWKTCLQTNEIHSEIHKLMSESSPWEIASEQQNVDCFILNIFTKQRSDGLSIVGRRQNCHCAQAGGVDLDGMDGETPLCGVSKAKKTEQLYTLFVRSFEGYSSNFCVTAVDIPKRITWLIHFFSSVSLIRFHL